MNQKKGVKRLQKEINMTLATSQCFHQDFIQCLKVVYLIGLIFRLFEDFLKDTKAYILNNLT